MAEYIAKTIKEMSRAITGNPRIITSGKTRTQPLLIFANFNEILPVLPYEIFRYTTIRSEMA